MRRLSDRMQQMQPHRTSPGQYFRPRLYGDYEEHDRIQNYDESNAFEFIYKGFLLRRDQDNQQLWGITTQDGRQVTGLHGRYVPVRVAMTKVDEYLKEQERGKTENNNNKTSS